MGFVNTARLAFNNYSFGNSFGFSNYSFNNFYGVSNSYSYKPLLFKFNYSGYTPTYSFGTASFSSKMSFGPSAYTFGPSSSTVKFGGLSKSVNRSGRSFSGSGNSSEYSALSKSAAINKAQADSRLEYIGNGGDGWTISDASFINDIKYATKGTSDLLDEVVAQIRKEDKDFNLVVTSALGTANSPHAKKAGHYDLSSVKLDFGGGLSRSQAARIANQLESTGKFEFARIECDGSTYHIDAQFKKELLA